MTHPPAVKHLRVKLFADGADRASMLALYARPEIEGFTTNPTLMAKVGITDYEAFSRDILATIADKPLSLASTRSPAPRSDVTPPRPNCSPEINASGLYWNWARTAHNQPEAKADR